MRPKVKPEGPQNGTPTAGGSGPSTEAAFQIAIRSLAARPYSVAELKQKLRLKRVTSKAIEETVTRLKKLGFLNDRKLAEQYASSLARNRAFGRFRVERELRARRVDPRSVEPALKAAFEEIDERGLLERVLDKKIGSLRLPLTRARLASLLAGLRRRGFRTEDIIRAVRARPELAPVADDADLEAVEE
ncbi:MAG TPA: regulatory protein RecX [Terriglobia bacterium]|nr:regulatory protein RecX [Terriglobia bacterium]